MGVINGKAYDWAEIQVSLPDFYMEFQEITYEDELEKEAVYGMGLMPRGYGRGNYKASGKISLLLDDYYDLLDYCKSKDISFFNIVWDKIVISYGDVGRPIRTDIITNITFTKKTGGGKQGDKKLLVDIDMLIFGKIVCDGVEPT